MNKQQFENMKKALAIVVIVIFAIGIISLLTSCEEQTVERIELTETVTGKNSDWNADECFPPCPTDTTDTNPNPLILCCEYYNTAGDTLFQCWTANNDCTICDSTVCVEQPEWAKDIVNDSNKRTE